MYIRDDIAYAGEPRRPIKVSGVRPLDNYQLWIRFNTGEAKTFDFAPLLNEPAFAPLRDKSVFGGVYIDYGVTVWNDGNIDISPEYLYENGSLDEVATDDLGDINFARDEYARGETVSHNDINRD